MKKNKLSQLKLTLIKCFAGLLSTCAAYCQVQIKGPDCVIPGNIYSYQFNADSLQAAKVTNVCIEGGTIYLKNTSCVQSTSGSGEYIQYVYVQWSDSVTTGSISATDSTGLISLQVTVVPVLTGGQLDSATMIQTVPYNTTASSIGCSVATGGNCSPAYYYWWEQSPDNIHWTEIPGAEDPNLQINSTFSSTTYFRRGVTETKGNSSTYSPVAIVFVGVPGN